MKKISFTIMILCFLTITVSAQDIFEAIRTGDLNLIEELIKKDSGIVNKTGDSPFTPLLFAVNNQKWEIAENLISAGANVNAVLLADYYGDTPVSLAIKKGNLEMIKLLHSNGADIQYRTKLGENYLHFAAAMNEVDIAEYLIDSGIDINAGKSGGLTPLHIAAITGSTDVASLLIDKGASMEIRSTDGGTPLHFALAARNRELVSLLRKAGARDIPREFLEYRGRYLGQNRPGNEPELFVPELFRDIYRSYGAPAFSPDGKELLWYGYFMPGIGYSNIWWMREEKGKWTAPELAPFSDYMSFSPAFSPDGKRFYFASRRPYGPDKKTDMNIWYAEKEEDGKWSKAKMAGFPPNRSEYHERSPAPAEDGSLYFTASGPGAGGTFLYKSGFINGAYTKPVPLEEYMDGGKMDPCQSMDEILFFKYGGPHYAEISICFHRPDGSWSKPVYTGDLLHQGQGSSDSKISPDGKYLFFVQNIAPYWVDASFIEELKEKELKD